MNRTFAVAAAIAAALIVPAVATSDSAEVGLPVEAYRLDNGLRVLLHEDHASPTVVVYVWYHVGSKDERPGRTGFAHLFEHLMFKGSKHVADGEFDRLLEAAGGWTNGTTSADRTNYFQQVPSNFLELALYLEADRMAGLWDAMSQDKLDNQRDVVKNERRQSYENRPYGMADLLIRKALWPPGHGNHNLTIGEMEDLDAASLDDVEAFYRSYYVPANATLVIAGDIDPPRARALVERYFGWMPKRPVPRHVTLEAPVTPRESEARLIDRDRVQLTKVMVTWRAPASFGEGEAALEVGAKILAGGKTSRLYRRLILDERLASQVSAYNYGQMLGGVFQISVLAEPGADPERILAIVDEEVDRLAREAPLEDEVGRARRVLESALLSSLEGLFARADRIAQYDAYTGSPDYLAKELAQLRSVSAGAVQQAVARWLGRDARVVMFVVPEETP